MVRIRIAEILEERNLSKYWLYKRLDMSYQNLNKIITNNTKRIDFDTLDKISDVLECDVGDLFEKKKNANNV